MKGVLRIIGFIGLFWINFACTPDRIFPLPPDQNKIEIKEGVLMVNEFVAYLSEQFNEYGNPEDWIELYNPNADTLFLEASRWAFTDDLEVPDKYTLPLDTFIVPLGYMVLWCDQEDKIEREIHTNFKLSSSGEDLGIYYTNDLSQLIPIDRYSYSPREDGRSEGRSPDGSDNWVLFPIASPGAKNQ